MHQVSCSIVVCLGFEIVNKHLSSVIDVVAFQSWIVFNGLVSADIIKAESWRRAVVIVIDVSENIGVFISCVLKRSPNHLHLLLIQTNLFVLIVNSGKEEGVETHSAEKRCRGSMMSKRIDMPGHIRNIVESLFEPSESHSHLINEILIVHASFVRHTPASINKLKLPVGNQGFHPTFLFVSGLIPPSIKESHLDNRKFVFGMICQFLNYGVYCVLNSSKLCSHVSSIVVVIYCFKPSNIIM